MTTSTSGDAVQASLSRYLQQCREAIVASLDGLADIDVRRPMTPSATNLLGLVKHLAGIELGYLGDSVGRPPAVQLPWVLDGSIWDGADMWATADETRDEILALYRAAWAHSDESIAVLGLDAPAAVSWWPEERRTTTLGDLLVRVVAETAQHAGHADIVRELLDGRTATETPAGGGDGGARYHAIVQNAAEAAVPSADRIARARELYERSVFGGESDVLEEADRELDAVEAGLTLARGRILHGRFLAHATEDPAELVLFERAAELYRSLADRAGEGDAHLWVGIFHQVVHSDDDQAVPALQRSLALARDAGDLLTASYALRHLGIAEHTASHTGAARAHLEESVRLRRELGFDAGVAANLVGLAYLAAGDGRRAEALRTLDEAAELARVSGANGLLSSIDEARSHVSQAPQE